MTVYLVGAGPGDPGLLTVRGAEVLRRADVVVYDRLSVAALLDLAPAGAERISVGKFPGHPSMEQPDINALLVERGRAGQEVVRLKGGDPFVFARGGEEAEALGQAGVVFEVVPGITSAVAVPAYAGVPLTYRGLSKSFTVVTGHEDPWAATETDWEAVARVGGTIVILMGVATRAAIAERLIAAGLAPGTPVAAVRWGTRPDQRSVRTTLGRLGAVELEPPVTMVIGAVAALNLRWFEDRPLFGRRVVVTRAREQASELVHRLRDLGAETVEVPAIVVGPASDDGEALRDAARRVRTFDWVAFTSANAVERFCAELPDARAFGDTRVAAVGPGTSAALARFGVHADLVPERSIAEALAEAFPAGSGRVLVPQAAAARDVVSDELGAKGWRVDVVEAYRTVPAEPSPTVLAEAGKADAITFTSSSTVTNYLRAAGLDAVPPLVACIGPITAETARAAGLGVDVVAGEHTVEGLVRALVEALC
ncbi:MAG: uroporphyrinogen-III synthase/uroporphyrinogen-III C-methyltransferase [Acidimicrobiales bacterium]|nr:uroporphyrinogen-III synthase/uroporphyrinogen-III C-methyltransferase [Acidimicrobiales bacterium]